MVNIRTKGQTGEREVATMLNDIVAAVRRGLGYPELEARDLPFQRNQNQSAVGGDDLTNPFGLAIEVKRQEVLSVNTWWKQCLQSALRTDGRAILIYRQNRKAWRVCMTGMLHLNQDKSIGPVRVEIELDVFKQWFAEYYRDWLAAH